VKCLAWLALCLLAFGAGALPAQDRSVSYSTWKITGNSVTLQFVLPVAEAQRLLGTQVPVLTTRRLEDYLLQHLTVQSAAGECPAIDQGFDLGRIDPLAVGPGLYGFEIFYRCTDTRRLVLHDTALFTAMPQHLNFASIEAHGRRVEQLFTARQQLVALPDERAPSAAGLTDYARLGVLHVLASPQHWILLLGVLALVRRGRDVGYVMVALVAGYGAALLVAVTGWVTTRPPLVQGVMGLVLALLGAALVQREARNASKAVIGWLAVSVVLALMALLRSPWAALAIAGAAAAAGGFLEMARRSGQLPLWSCLAGAFAFLDGLLLPAVLEPAQLSRASQARLLVGFDLGAFGVAALLSGLAMAAWMWLRTQRLPAVRALLNDVCAASLCGLGVFWTLSTLG
jgi:HupE / UreJ protein